MSQDTVAMAEELVRRLTGGMRAIQLYAPDHPLVARQMTAILDALRALHAQSSPIIVGFVAGQVVVGDRPLPRLTGQLGELIERVTFAGVERIAFDEGVTLSELQAFVGTLSRSLGTSGGDPVTGTRHIRVGRIAGDRDEAPSPGEGRRATLLRLYGDAVGQAEGVWEAALHEGRPDVTAAATAIDHLADAVTENRTALIALAAMKHYDTYTFTHMVNVSILTMAQARAIGIEGRLLREFGLAALLHDVGKVKTPKEILNKPSQLDAREFAIMQRHTVDGAALLRQTPEIPALAPVVAFEHHLRLDGQGYPGGVVRTSLNLATMLCSIADVYDAMRSKREYQDAFPTDRILAVLKRNDGVQFDQHLVRRFVQLMGIYPPGTVVSLSDGRLAVVTAVHAPAPDRPRVRVVHPAGDAATSDLDIDLWAQPEDGIVVTSVVDPARVDIDPLDLFG